MDDMFLSVIFFIMFLVIIGTIIYLTYNFIDYKGNVDESISTTTDYINNSVTLLNSNIINTEKKFKKNINNFNNKITDTKKDLEESINITNQSVLLNSEKLDNMIGNDNNFDSLLNTYFDFKIKNEDTVANQKLYERTFNTNDITDLNIKSKATALSGITINTMPDIYNENNLRICDNKGAEFNNCININITDDKFNITPENINSLSINNRENTAIANFDLQNNSIQLGNSGIEAPLIIQNNRVYINDLSIVRSTSKKTNDISEIDTNVLVRASDNKLSALDYEYDYII